MKKVTEIKEVETWEELCAAVGIDPVQSLAWADNLQEEDKAPQIALFRLTKLSKYYWGEEIPSFKDRNQEKWFPVFYGTHSTAPSGFGFSDSYAHFGGTHTSVGARLSYPTEELSDSAAKNFLPWYYDLMVREN